MNSIATRERDKYAEMWSISQYAEMSPGEKHLPLFLDMVGSGRGMVLDAGCGSGKGALALDRVGFNVMCCDITNEGLSPEARRFPFFRTCLWDDLKRQTGLSFDWVYCCDVMEHVPPTFTMLVVSRLLEVAERGVFFSIATTPDVMGAWIGKPLHLTVQSYVDWRDQLATVGTLVESRDLLNAGVYMVQQR